MKKWIAFVLMLITIEVVNSQWIEQTSGVTTSLNCVSSLNSVITQSHGWICGNSGIVLKTSNGGTDWINVSSGIPSSINLTHIIGLSGANSKALTSGINSGNSAVIYLTTNGGLNWQNTFSIPNGNIYGILEQGPASNLLLIGKPLGGRWSIYHSTNGGLTWDSTGTYLPQAGGELGFNNSVFINDEKIWFGTNNSHTYYSYSGGAFWVTQSTFPEVNSSAIWFRYLLTDVSTGVGLTAGSGMLKSNNLGMNWTPVNTVGSGVITGIAAPFDMEKTFYSRGNQIYLGISETNWSLQYTAPNGIYTHMSNSKVGSQHVWAVRNNGGISKYTGTIGINIISTEIPNSYSLSQNYPNPFNPSTKIRFSIPQNETTQRDVSAKLVVYDALGREVQTLVNENLSPGTYEVDFDGSNLPSGVYFYKLESGSFIETKKMVLIK